MLENIVTDKQKTGRKRILDLPEDAENRVEGCVDNEEIKKKIAIKRTFILRL